MPSFRISIKPNRRAAARFIGQVRRGLQRAYGEEQKKRGLSQSDIARSLEIHRSVINRELKGFKDITLGRVAELAWAMGRRPLIEFPEITDDRQNVDSESSLRTKTDYSLAESGEEIVTSDSQFDLDEAA
jgi:hypothetical protein